MTPEEGGKGQRKPKPKRHMDDEQGRVSVNSKKGHSVLPTARITKIIKADEDIGIASKEAVFLISLATVRPFSPLDTSRVLDLLSQEHFIRKLMLASYTEARLERRVAVRYNDVAKAVGNHDHFFYLADVVPPTLTAAEARRKLAFANPAAQDDTSPPLPQPAAFPSSSSSVPPPDQAQPSQGGLNGDLAAANGLGGKVEAAPVPWQPMDVDPGRSSSDEELP